MVIREKIILVLNSIIPRQHSQLLDAKFDRAAYSQAEFENAQRSLNFFPLVVELAGKDVLDVGCGLGGTSTYYALHGAKSVVGLDVSSFNIGAARQFAQRKIPHNQDYRIEFFLADAEQMPFSDNSFDLVISTYTFEHIPHPFEALKECVRVARPGGSVLVSFPPYYSPWGAHLNSWIHWPWVQVLFSERTLLKIAQVIESQKKLNDRFDTFAEIDLATSEGLDFLNKLTVREFRRMAKSFAQHSVELTTVPVGVELGLPLSAFSTFLARVPVFEEMFVSKMILVLKKDSLSPLE